MIFQDIISLLHIQVWLKKTANLHVADTRLLQEIYDVNCVNKVCEHSLWMVGVWFIFEHVLWIGRVWLTLWTRTVEKESLIILSRCTVNTEVLV